MLTAAQGAWDVWLTRVLLWEVTDVGYEYVFVRVPTLRDIREHGFLHDWTTTTPPQRFVVVSPSEGGDIYLRDYATKRAALRGAQSDLSHANLVASHLIDLVRRTVRAITFTPTVAP